MNKQYKQYIQQVNIGSLASKTAWISSSLKSTELMTQLKHRFDNDAIDRNCEDAFDVLYLVLINKKSRIYYSFGKLVIMYIPNEVRLAFHPTFDLKDRTMTFTDLKKKRLSFWLDKFKQEKYEEVILSNETKLNLWETPLILEATTDYDKDFRKEWDGNWLVYEGNEYGDTSTFYIIGYID